VGWVFVPTAQGTLVGKAIRVFLSALRREAVQIGDLFLSLFFLQKSVLFCFGRECSKKKPTL
jgi:hypothetical protein